MLSSLRAGQDACDNQGTKILIFMWGIAIHPKLSVGHAVWIYHRFTLSFRDIEELLAARGITVSYETIRNWCLNFGKQYCNQIRKWVIEFDRSMH